MISGGDPGMGADSLSQKINLGAIGTRAGDKTGYGSRTRFSSLYRESFKSNQGKSVNLSSPTEGVWLQVKSCNANVISPDNMFFS